MAEDLSGRVAIVAGGAGFLGRDIVEGLLAAKCKVVILDRVEAPASSDPDILHIRCDLTDPQETATAIEKAWTEAGPIQILVNAVGMIHNEPLISITAAGDRKHSLQSWRATIDANLTTVFLATVNQVDYMISTRTRGVVISLSSISAAGNAGQSAYSAAKAAVNSMTLAWAKELGLLGIRFVAIAPGFIDTSSTHDAVSENILLDWKKKTPLRKLGKMSEITSSVLFAIQNEYLNGKVLEVDGGLTL